MQIQIDNSSNRPVYQQIIDAVKRDIALERIKLGEKLPTVRQLAGELVINPNTIAKAYRQLEAEGIITTRPGSGAFVAEMNSNISKSVRKKIVIQELERIAIDAVHMQISNEELTQWFAEVIKKFKNTFGE